MLRKTLLIFALLPCTLYCSQSHLLPEKDQNELVATILDPILENTYVDGLVLQKHVVSDTTLRKYVEQEISKMLCEDWGDILATTLASSSISINNGMPLSVVFCEDESHEDYGKYIRREHTLKLYANLQDSKLVFRTFFHELTHALLEYRYNNKMNPYPVINNGLKEKFDLAMQTTLNNIELFEFDENYSLFYKILSTSIDTEHYKPHAFHLEFIARFIEITSLGYLLDPIIREKLTPIIQYWQEEIAPDLQKSMEPGHLEVNLCNFTK